MFHILIINTGVQEVQGWWIRIMSTGLKNWLGTKALSNVKQWYYKNINITFKTMLCLKGSSPCKTPNLPSDVRGLVLVFRGIPPVYMGQMNSGFFLSSQLPSREVVWEVPWGQLSLCEAKVLSPLQLQISLFGETYPPHPGKLRKDFTDSLGFTPCLLPEGCSGG